MFCVYRSCVSNNLLQQKGNLTAEKSGFYFPSLANLLFSTSV